MDDLSHGALENLETCFEHRRFRFVELDCAAQGALIPESRRLRGDRAPRGAEDPALRRRPEDARGECRGRALGVRERPASRGARRPRVDLGRLRDRSSAPREDASLTLGAPTTRRWAYASSKLYNEHLGLALAEERGLRFPTSFVCSGATDRATIRAGGAGLKRRSSRTCSTAGRWSSTATGARCGPSPSSRIRSIVRSRARLAECRGEIINVGIDQPTSIVSLRSRSRRRWTRRRHCGLFTCPTRASGGRYQDVRRRIPTRRRRPECWAFTPRWADEGLPRTVAWHRARRGVSPTAARPARASWCRRFDDPFRHPRLQRAREHPPPMAELAPREALAAPRIVVDDGSTDGTRDTIAAGRQDLISPPSGHARIRPWGGDETGLRAALPRRRRPCDRHAGGRHHLEPRGPAGHAGLLRRGL